MAFSQYPESLEKLESSDVLRQEGHQIRGKNNPQFGDSLKNVRIL